MDDATTLRIARLIDVTENLTRAIAGLDRLDDERKGDIDELREEVAALGARVDAMSRRLESVAHTAEQAALPGRIMG